MKKFTMEQINDAHHMMEMTGEKCDWSMADRLSALITITEHQMGRGVVRDQQTGALKVDETLETRYVVLADSILDGKLANIRMLALVRPNIIQDIMIMALAYLVEKYGEDVFDAVIDPERMESFKGRMIAKGTAERVGD